MQFYVLTDPVITKSCRGQKIYFGLFFSHKVYRSYILSVKVVVINLGFVFLNKWSFVQTVV
jgi:hypothetical protein